MLNLVYFLGTAAATHSDLSLLGVVKALQDSPAQAPNRALSRRLSFQTSGDDSIARVQAHAPAALASIPKAKAQYDFGLSPGNWGPDRRLGAGLVALQVTNVFGAHVNLEFVGEFMDHGESPSNWDMACPFELLPAQRQFCANVEQILPRTDPNKPYKDVSGSEGVIVYRVRNLTPFVDTIEDVDVAIYWNKNGAGMMGDDGWKAFEKPTVAAMVGENLVPSLSLFLEMKMGEATNRAALSEEGFTLRSSGIQVDSLIGDGTMTMLAFNIGPDTQLLEANRAEWEAAYPGLQQLASRVCAKYGHPEGVYSRSDVCKGEWIGSVAEIQMLGVSDETVRYNCLKDPNCGGFWLKDQYGYKFSDLDEDTTCDMGACTGIYDDVECEIISHFSFEGGNNVYCTDVEYIH